VVLRRSSARRTEASLYPPHRRSLVGERPKKERSGLTDERKTLGEDGGISIPDLDVVAARGARVETDRTRNYECRGFRFRLEDTLRGGAAAFSAMQEFMGQLMSQSGKLFGRRLAGEKYDFPAIGDAPSGSDLVRIFECASAGRSLKRKTVVTGGLRARELEE
jgi:hypothetical protein